ncbi:MAG TPA: selenocysteine-specific translation elongation factor [Longimicrobiales bacterium]|nr:selenocysteine-specific translation elongation factor [Longimicrobiales bacterium]
MRRLILGTAGHIDHGKTALVRALTGTDTDRLPEEKRRGITIDLGFARLPLGDAMELSVVDVPGHEAFIRNMLAGASGIDLVLLVVAADEGVMPQTREHAAIIELLGIRHGVVALTKSDLVDEDWLELVRDDVATLLAGTPLAACDVVPVSARTGAGIGALTEALAAAAEGVERRAGEDLFRMPVDRVLTVHGTGTVVTGTVWSGALGLSDTVRLEPAGLTARVRGLQQHGEACDVVTAGARAAVALTGVDRHALERGETLVSSPVWKAASILTVALRMVRDDAVLRPRQRVRVHLGTAEVLARVALLPGELGPADEALVQLRLEAPVVARAGDHLVIRSYSPVHTIAGGMVLEPAAPKRKRVDAPLEQALRALPGSVRAVLELAGETGAQVAQLPLLTGLTPGQVQAELPSCDAVSVADRAVPASFLLSLRGRILQRLAAFHAAAPLEEGMEREALRRDCTPASAALFDAAMAGLIGEGAVVQRQGGAALADHYPTAGPAAREALDRLTAFYRAAGLEAPDTADLPPGLADAADLPALLRFLERDGILVRVTPGRWTDAGAIRDAVAALRSQLPTGQPLGVADLKEVLGLSRKHLIPLLEYLDRIGVTRREGDARVLFAGDGAGPDTSRNLATGNPQVRAQ